MALTAFAKIFHNGKSNINFKNIVSLSKHVARDLRFDKNSKCCTKSHVPIRKVFADLCSQIYCL